MNERKNCICFGLTLYNNARYLPEALESILNQTYRNFNIVALDDCSDDGTRKLMEEYAVRDNRIVYLRNESRKGLIKTWRSVFLESERKFNPDYFAWISDHDIWDCEWLQEHLKILEKNRKAVLAYPIVKKINENGTIIDNQKIEPLFDTDNLPDIQRIFNVCTKLTGAGNKIYGLFRTKALKKAGVFRYFTLPDRLLLTELSIYGSFKQIDRCLFKRRIFREEPNINETVQKQVTSLFGEKNIPLHARFPHIAHSVSIPLNALISNNMEYFTQSLLAAIFLWEKNKNIFIKAELSTLKEIISKGSAEKILGFDSNLQIDREDIGILNLTNTLFNGLKGRDPNVRFNQSRKWLHNNTEMCIFGAVIYHYLKESGQKETIRDKNYQIEILRIRNDVLTKKNVNMLTKVKNLIESNKLMLKKIETKNKAKNTLKNIIANRDEKIERSNSVIKSLKAEIEAQKIIAENAKNEIAVLKNIIDKKGIKDRSCE